MRDVFVDTALRLAAGPAVLSAYLVLIAKVAVSLLRHVVPLARANLLRAFPWIVLFHCLVVGASDALACVLSKDEMAIFALLMDAGLIVVSRIANLSQWAVPTRQLLFTIFQNVYLLLVNLAYCLLALAGVVAGLELVFGTGFAFCVSSHFLRWLAELDLARPVLVISISELILRASDTFSFTCNSLSSWTGNLLTIC